MIEKAITENTQAVQTLTEAVEALNAAIANLLGAEVSTQKSQPNKAKSKKEEPEAEEPEAEEPEAEEPEADTPSLGELTDLAVKVRDGKGVATLRAALEKVGVARVSKCPEEKRGELYAELKRQL